MERTEKQSDKEEDEMNLRYARRASVPALCSVAALGAVLVVSTPAFADDAHHVTVTADQVAWKPGPPTLPPGAEFAVLHGNPAEEGQFVLRLKFPANYRIPPHLHPKEEHVTVISGAFGMGAGKEFDQESAPLLEPGSFVRIPVGMAHYAWTDRETVVQLNSIGPFGVEYVNPGDDPRTN
ncbi:cupin domain-containing protein [Chelativorans sp. M5D2P16]|uniref:cupin domain-containing protein n=1 Tax=Chelativorans sp. M5D2P16 TaxID=3095678 RepID=UPI002ACA6609|nr:cupin domain-containing protein [Chelativorans sp. M5D2P16]MDZ5698584.1 cupin domain-containing protein [Chelativorans sp. M5D2P16]